MASWAGLLALSGFGYSAATRTFAFRKARRPVRWFWSNGYAWATLTQEPRRKGALVALKVLRGRLKPKGLGLSAAPHDQLAIARLHG